MRTKILLTALLVALLHGVGVVFVLCSSGCGQRLGVVAPPPPPTMPPTLAPAGTAPLMPAEAAPAAPAPAVAEGPAAVVHTVQAGETLSGIASKSGVSLNEILRANDLADPDKLVVGQNLRIPSTGGGESRQTAQPPVFVAEGTKHVVTKGDCLSEIALNYGTTVAALRAANGLSGDTIFIGQELSIPGEGIQDIRREPAQHRSVEPTPPKREREKPASVSIEPIPEPDPGDAERVSAIEERMPDEAEPLETLGEPTVEPADTSPAEQVVTEVDMGVPAVSVLEPPRYHHVEQGEDLESIAEMYPGVRPDDIMRVNGLKSPKVEPGRRLRIPASSL